MIIELNAKEEQKYKDFVKAHDVCAHVYLGAIGGHFSITSLFTSVGTIHAVKCGVCKKEEDITDYGCW